MQKSVCVNKIFKECCNDLVSTCWATFLLQLQQSLYMSWCLLNVLNVTTLALDEIIWRFIWECTQVRNLTSVLSAITLVLNQVIWRFIWEYTQVRNLTSVLSVITPVLNRVIWRDIWKSTLLLSINSFEETYESANRKCIQPRYVSLLWFALHSEIKKVFLTSLFLIQILWK